LYGNLIFSVLDACHGLLQVDLLTSVQAAFSAGKALTNGEYDLERDMQKMW
jgi:hypothetical protein